VVGIFGRVGKAISSGFGAFGGAAPPTSNSKPNGGDGVQAYGGYLVDNERRPELTGSRKWITYGNATNTAIVATGLRRTLDLLAGTEWHAEPNEYGGRNAQRGADLVTKGLLKASLPKPWSTVVRKAALYKYYGFSLHEWSTKRASDGKIVFADIAHRPQYTVDRWDKPDERMPWQAVSQLTRTGNRWVIPRERLFYAVDDMLTDSPDGTGLMRHIIELVRKLGVFEGLEALAYETDLRGMPIGRAPIGELVAKAVADSGGDRAKVQSYVTERTQKLANALQAIVKTPDKLQYLLLDSASYTGADENTFSAIQKWGFDLLKGESNGVPEVAAAIGRIQLEIARVLGIEFAMVGGNDSAGSFGMHADKTSAFATTLQTTLTELAAFATNDLARTLVGLNGLDVETCTPKLVAEPISMDAIEGVCRSLAMLSQAGLQPDDEAIGVLRRRMHLPPAPEPTAATMGLLGMRGAPPPGQGPPTDPNNPTPGESSGPPDPARGEVDIEVDDLGAKPGKQVAAGKVR
jgi:hypothetical protein